MYVEAYQNSSERRHKGKEIRQICHGVTELNRITAFSRPIFCDTL